MVKGSSGGDKPRSPKPQGVSLSGGAKGAANKATKGAVRDASIGAVKGAATGAGGGYAGMAAGAARGAAQGASKNVAVNSASGAAEGALGAKASPPSRLGAGGTSFAGAEAKQQAGENRKPDAKEDAEKKVGMKAALAASTVPAAIIAMQVVFLMVLLKILKGIALAALAAVTNMLNMILAWAIGLAKQLGGALLGLGASLSAAVGGAVSAATSAAGVVGVGGVALSMLVGGVVANNNATETLRADGQINCLPVAQRTLDNVQTDAGSMSAAANAELIYSVLAAWGMPDENIAGMLGNWDAESEIDPTGVETVFNEPHEIGPMKQEAWDLGWDIGAFNPQYAATYPAIDKMGIGLGQWTNGRNTLLMNYADSSNREWYEIETQLGFMVSDDDPPRVAYIKDSIENSRGSVSDATLSFMKDWEGLTDGSTSKRLDAAEHWMAMFGAWGIDQGLADSILAQSGTTVDSANQARAAAVRSECQDSATAVAAGDSNYTGDISADGWAEPTETMHVTSLWGPRVHPSGVCRSHGGLDLDGSEGDPYFAANDGTVTAAEWEVGGGFTLTLELADGSGFVKYLHTHASSNSPSGTPEFFVSPGDVVKAGDHLGNIGNSGESFGAHLHFEIHERDSTWAGWPQGWSGSINPKPFYEDQGFAFSGVQGTANSC